MKVILEIKDCDECGYYRYIRCYGYDCHHPKAPDEEARGEESLAENREGNFPKWCPYNKQSSRPLLTAADRSVRSI